MNKANADIEHIIQLCKQGNQQGKKALFEMFSPKMMALCYRYLGNKQDAEDAMIDGFIAVLEHITKFKEGNFHGWIYRIMVNSCLSILNKQKKLVLKEDNVFFESNTNIEITNSEKFSSEELMAALQSLPFTLKTVFNMSVIEGYTNEEIAQFLHITKNSVKTNLYKAKIRLRDYLLNMDK